MYRYGLIIPAIFLVVLAGCVARQKADSTGSKPHSAAAKLKADTRKVTSEDGLVKGEIIGIPAPESKFSRLKIGMKLEQVERLIGEPDDTNSRITGRHYQPFYFGGDTQRTEAFYKNEGQLTFSNIQHDSAVDTLIRITVNPKATGNHFSMDIKPKASGAD